ncbi:hypothetical protein [Rhodoferax sp.]|uniref:hypothetical protein n=1 Tax=Rhodoferax sp. TaxID=50421 RepID=UPI002749817A|nr:hypothetical protein [Rhodoferax sp.]
MKRIPLKLQPWFDARQRFKLTHAEVQMARELGMNPKQFGGLANTRQEPWKVPLREFIANCYRKSFGREAPQDVRSLEEMITADQDRRARKLEKKAQALADYGASDAPPP